jgi:capsular polysaccharide biosynthesis protein
MNGLLPVAKRWWWLLTVAAVVAGLTSYAAASRLEPTYEAEARLLVGPINTDNDTLRAASSLAKTYAALATSSPLMDATARELNLDPSENLYAKVDVTANDVTRVLTVHARDPDPQRAATIANTLADKLLSLPTSGLSRPEGHLQIVDRAQVARNSVGPGPFLLVPLAAIAALLAALGVALVVEALNGTVRNATELAEITPLAFLGSINGARAAPGDPLVVQAKPASREAAAYRLLAAKIQYANGQTRPRSLLVVPPARSTSATQVAANLASALSETGAKVGLADVSATGELARFLELDGDGGDDAVAEPLETVRCRWTRLQLFSMKQHPRLVVLPRIVGQPADVEDARSAIDVLLEKCDFVVLATLPIDTFPSSLVWARAADATVLLVERDRTKRETITPAVQSLDLVGAHLVGTVLAGDRV